MVQTRSPTRNRRADIRRIPKSRLQVTCRKGSMGLGPNLAEAVLDISEMGIRLLVSSALEKGQEIEVTLTAPSQIHPLKRMGSVIWSLPTADGRHCMGVQFSKRLSYADFSRLT